MSAGIFPQRGVEFGGRRSSSLRKQGAGVSTW
jgi:hypothetical protein